MNELLADMGQRIFRLRKQQRLTQEELGNKAGVGYQTISNAERGVKALRPGNIVKISQALGVSTDYLLTRKSNAIDCSVLSDKLSSVDPVKRDLILRAVDIMLEET